MFILLTPQVNEADKLSYQFEGEKIIVDYNGIVDRFDFTGMPDGYASNADRREGDMITTILPIMPIIDARKENGVLKVRLVNFIPLNASEEEKYPVWKEVGV